MLWTGIGAALERFWDVAQTSRRFARLCMPGLWPFEPKSALKLPCGTLRIQLPLLAKKPMLARRAFVVANQFSALCRVHFLSRAAAAKEYISRVKAVSSAGGEQHDDEAYDDDKDDPVGARLRHKVKEVRFPLFFYPHGMGFLQADCFSYQACPLRRSSWRCTSSAVTSSIHTARRH